MAAQPEAPETLNYTRYVLDIGHSGDALDLLVALMPCVAGYAEIGLGLLQHPATRLDDNPYASWIRNYGDEGYLQGVSAALALLETVWQQRGSEARITELSEIFTTATRLEAQFWQMGLNAAAETRRDGAGYRGPWPEPACRRPSAVRQPVVYGPRRAVGVAARRQRRRQNQPAAGDGRSGARHPRRSGRQRWATDSGRLAWMGQKDLLYPWLSVRDNVAPGARLRGEKVDRARVAALLEQVGASSCADARPATLPAAASARCAGAHVSRGLPHRADG